MSNLPSKLLNEIGEFTDGFLLISITPDGNIDVHDGLTSMVQELAVDKFLEQYVRHNEEVSLCEFMDDFYSDEGGEHKED